jgi:hypothetical protein
MKSKFARTFDEYADRVLVAGGMAFLSDGNAKVYHGFPESL